MSKNVKLLRL